MPCETEKSIIKIHAEMAETKNGAAFDGAPLFIFFTPAPASHAPIREIRDSLMKAT